MFGLTLTVAVICDFDGRGELLVSAGPDWWSSFWIITLCSGAWKGAWAISLDGVVDGSSMVLTCFSFSSICGFVSFGVSMFGTTVVGRARSSSLDLFAGAVISGWLDFSSVPTLLEDSCSAGVGRDDVVVPSSLETTVVIPSSVKVTVTSSLS